MAYKPPVRQQFSTTYTPKLMAGGMQTKKVAAPEQPTGMVIRSRTICAYVSSLFDDKQHRRHNLDEYKRLFEQIKILVKSVMNVLCETNYVIDRSLFDLINKQYMSNYKSFMSSDISITFPVSRYDYTKWIYMFRALIPISGYPFLETDDMLNESAYIECIYEQAIYVYQNLLLTASSKKREMIEEKYRDTTSANKNYRVKSYQRMKDERKKELDEMKQSMYQWINRLGHIIKENGYPLLGEYTHLIDWSAPIDEDDESFETFMEQTDLLLIAGTLCNSFEHCGIVDERYSQLLSPYHKKEKEMYREAIRYYRTNMYASTDNEEIQWFYTTVADLLNLFMKLHYGDIDKMIFEFEIKSIIEAYLNRSVKPHDQQIRLLVNKIVDKNYDYTYSQLILYPIDTLLDVVLNTLNAEPQQRNNIRLLHDIFTEFIVNDCREMDNSYDWIIDKIRARLMQNRKTSQSYYDTVGWCIIFKLLPLSVLNDYRITPDRAKSEILSAFMTRSVEEKYILTDTDTIHTLYNNTINVTSGYYKFRLNDAYNEWKKMINEA